MGAKFGLFNSTEFPVSQLVDEAHDFSILRDAIADLKTSDPNLDLVAANFEHVVLQHVDVGGTIELWRPVDKYVEQGIGSTTYWTVTSIASCFAIMTLVLLGLNIRWRNEKILRMSSANVNNVILIGSAMLFITSYLSADATIVSPDSMGTVCRARIWVLLLGFQVMFAPLFTKIYRVHVIFRSSHLKVQIFKDSKVFQIVAGLVLFDVVLLGIWTAMTSMSVSSLVETPALVSGLWQAKRTHRCSSQDSDVWFAVFVAIKAVLLFGGIVLAFTTRHVRLAALNDSKPVGFSIYLVFLSSVMLLPISSVADDTRVLFIVSSIVIMLTVSAILIILFGKNMYMIATNDTESLAEATGSIVGNSSQSAVKYVPSNEHIKCTTCPNCGHPITSIRTYTHTKRSSKVTPIGVHGTSVTSVVSKE